MMSILLQTVARADDISAICTQMQPDVWGADNHMMSYQPGLLRTFLESGGTLILARSGDVIVGAALAYTLRHPAGENSLYVHELDTHPAYRRQGIATQLMDACKRFAAHEGLQEVWLGAEVANASANALYKSLDPYEIEPSVIYSYKVQ